MSYLDNLENNLKALENQEERDPEKVKREQERREGVGAHVWVLSLDPVLDLGGGRVLVSTGSGFCGGLGQT